MAQDEVAEIEVTESEIGDILSSTATAPEREPQHTIDDEVVAYDTLVPTELKAAFDEINSAIEALTATVVTTLEQIAPYLSKMQRLLSQRGDKSRFARTLRKAGIPTWSKWSAEYAKKLGVSKRTIERHIKALREGGKPRPKPVKNGGKLRLDSRQKAALVKAAVAGGDIVKAYDAGADLAAPIAQYRTAR